MLKIVPQIMINKKKEVSKILKMCYDESNALQPTMIFMRFAKIKNKCSPTTKVLETLKDKGYFASRTHFKPVDVLDEIVYHLSP
jgi:tRNA (guanine26-N2/guanine27-N2)-dimethyltransferase